MRSPVRQCEGRQLPDVEFYEAVCWGQRNYNRPSVLKLNDSISVDAFDIAIALTSISPS